MANKTNSQRLIESRRKREEEKLGSSSSSASYRNSDKLRKRKLEREINFDTFESDLQSMGTTIGNIYSGWQSQETMANTRASVESMQNRINAYQDYQKRFGGRDISDVASGYQSVLDDWDKLSSAYGYYKNADAYDKAMQTLKFDKDFAGLTYDEVQAKKKEYGEGTAEHEYFSNYTGYTNLADFEKALENTKSKDNKRTVDGKVSTYLEGGNPQKEQSGHYNLKGANDVEKKESTYAEKLEAEMNKFKLDNAGDKYLSMTKDEDFAENSKYVPTEAKRDVFGKTYYEDEIYEYINNPDRRADIDLFYNSNMVMSGNASVSLTPYQSANYDQMTDTERGIFNALWKEDKNSAYAYLEEIQMMLDKRATDKLATDVTTAMDDEKYGKLVSPLLSVATPVMSLAGGISDAGDVFASTFFGVDYNPYDSDHATTNLKNVIRGKRSEQLGENGTELPVVGNVNSFLYNTGMSIADTALGAFTLGTAYTPIMGMSAYQQTAKELTEAGASQDEIKTISLISGIAEAGFEYAGIDNLFKTTGSDSVKSILKNTLKQMGAESLEETGTEIVNIIADTWVRGGNSEYQQMYEDLLARGFTEKEAQTEIAKDIGSRVAQAGIGGALSGGVMGGVFSTKQHHDLKSTGAELRENDRTQDIMDMFTPEEAETYKLYSQYANKGVTADNIKDAQLGNLYATKEADAVDTLKSKKTTAEQKESAYRTLNALNTYRDTPNTKVKATGEKVEIEGMKKVDGETVLSTSNGDMSLNDVQLSSNDAELLSYAESMSEDKANVFVAQYDGTSDVEAYKNSFEMAYAYGETGFGADSVLKNKGILTEAQASEIYKSAITNKVAVQQKAIDEINAKYGKTVTVAGTFNDSIIDYNSTNADGSKVNWNSLTTKQRDAITLAKGFSEATGVNITFIKSDVVDGKRVGKNGSYNPETNTIEIDVYAGRIDASALNDSIIPTLSHEMTHWMKSKSPAMYAKMREHIMETLATDGKLTSDERVSSEMARIQKNHPDIKVTEEMAIDEIMARACEDMLSNSDTARKMLGRMTKKEQSSFIAKVKETFDNLMQWVNDLLGQYKSNSKEAEVLRQYKDRLKQLSKMWDKALAEAVQTNQSLQQENAQEFIKNAVVQNMDRETEMDLDATVEMTDDLIAVHNLTEEKLAKTFKLEGFPMPSIAITRASLGHSNFGSISFVFGKKTIDPSNRKNKVYGADAWTPTFPRVEYEADTKRVYEIEKELKPLVDKLPERFKYSANSLISGLDYNLDNYGGYEGVVERALNDDAIKQLYLATTDDVVEDVTVEKRIEMNEMDIAISKNIIEAIGVDISETANMTGHEIYDNYGYQIAESMKKVYIENFGFSDEQAQNVIDNSKKLGIVRQFRTAKNYALNGSVKVETEIDFGATRDAINSKIDDAKYEEWVRETFKGIVKNEGIHNGKERFTPSGNLRSFSQTHLPITADNIVKAMIAQNDDVRNVSGFNGIKSIRAVAVEEFKNIKSIKQARNKLKNIDSIEYEEMNERLSHRLYEVIGDIVNASKKRSTGNTFMDMDSAGYAILDACGNPTASNIKKLLESYSWNVTDAQAKEIESIINEVVNMPVNMFEAKPQRVVGFDEILYAVVPDNISNESRGLIEEKNIPIREYEAGNDEDRMKVLNSLEGVQFSDRYVVSEVSGRLTNSEWNMLNKLVGLYNKGDVYQKSADGDIIIPIGNKLIYTDAKLGNVGISKIVEFISEHEDEIDMARRRIYDAEKRKSEVKDAYRIIENLYGDGFVNEYTAYADGEAKRFDRRTKRGKSKSDAYHANFRQATIEKVRRIAGFVDGDVEQYSDRDYAPTFYSHMGKVVSDIKQAKLGADSVIPYLKGKGVKDEEIKWSGIAEFLDGKKSVTKAELEEFVAGSMLQIEEETLSSYVGKLDSLMREYMNATVEDFSYPDDTIDYGKLIDAVEKQLSDGDITAKQYADLADAIRYAREYLGTHWHDYTLKGGSNYRELLFKMPDSDYYNQAMLKHWDETGVLAHARVQDFDTNDGKMLFIEEIQSDWHNEGQKEGYFDAKEYKNKYDAVRNKLYNISQEKRALEDKLKSMPKNKHLEERKAIENALSELVSKQSMAWEESNRLDKQFEGKATDAPFKNNYHEYVLKRLIRMASEEGYSSIGWTTGKIQEERWSSEFAEGYRIEYDQDIPKFLRKYGKKWGATVGKTDIQTKHLSMEEEADLYFMADIVEDSEGYIRDAKGIKEVWSMTITDAMRDSVLYEGQSMYSDRDNESIYDLMGENESLKKQNAKLEEDVNRLKERLKLERTITKGNTFNENQLNAVAGHLRKVTNSTYDKDALVEELRDVYSYIVTSEQLDWTDVMVKCSEVAKNVLNESKGYKVTNDYYKSVLEDIRRARITLNDEQIQEAKYAFGERYRDAFMGRVMLVKNGTSLDQKWQEWAYNYPEIFDADIPPAEQIVELSSIYDALREGAENYEQYNDAESIRAFAVEIYNQYWNVSTIRTTADKHDKEIKRLNFEHRKAMNELRADYKKRVEDQKKADAIYYGKKISDIRRRRDAEVKRAKESGKQRLDAYKDRIARNNMIDSITNKAITLNKWLTKNSKEEHIPEVMKVPVAYLLDAIDFSSKQLLSMRGGIKAGTPTKKDVSLSKALEQVHDMVQKINSAQIGEDEITEIYGTFADFPVGFADDIKALSGTVNDIMRTVGDNAYVLNQMSLEELESLDAIVSIMKSTVTKMNKFLAIRHAEGVANMSQQSILYMDSLGKAKERGELGKKVEKMLDWNNALPYYTFKRFGEGGQKVYEALQDGWDKFAFHVRDIINYAEDTYNSKEVKEWSESVKEFEVLEPATDKEKADPNYKPRYQKVQMTVPQIMSLYCLQKREQAKGHLFGGGMRVADFDVKGKTVSQTEGIILSDSELDKIISSLTDRQRAVADELQKFMNTTCADWGNEVSMLRFGYKAFGEENYFPIQSDKNNLAVNDETEQNNSLFRLLNMSFTKGTIKQANNRIVISNIFDVFAQHSSDMAKYNALALPVLDSFKWYNYKEKIKKGDTQFTTKSLKQSLENAFGKDGQNYIVTFLRDINGEQSGGRDAVGSKFFSNAKLASVGFNIRVVALQPTSYLRASAVIDNKYLIKAFAGNPRKGIEKAMEHCGIALWKSLGFYDTNINRGVADLIKHEDTFRDKVADVSLKGAEIADKVTWGYLWKACEFEVKDKQKNLKVGSEEFYKAVADRLREVIYTTQVVDSTMTRSQMMRGTGMYDKMLTSFASEPTLAYNMLQDAYMDWKLTERQTGSVQKAFKKHGKKLARVFTAYTVTNLLSALVELGFDIFRDEEDEMTVEEIIALYLKNFASNMSILNKIPYAREAVSMLQGYSSSRTDTQWLQYATYAVNGLAKNLQGEGNPYTTFKNLLRAISYGSGMPLYNVWRDSTALLNKVDALTAEDLEEMFNETIGEIYPSLKSK